MKAAAYCPETVREIRDRSDRGQSESSLAHHLGWDLTMLRGVARKHAITLVALDDTAKYTHTSMRLSLSEHANDRKEQRGLPNVVSAVEPEKPKRAPKPPQTKRVWNRRPDGVTYPAMLNGRVTEAMGRDVYNYAVRENTSALSDRDRHRRVHPRRCDLHTEGWMADRDRHTQCRLVPRKDAKGEDQNWFARKIDARGELSDWTPMRCAAEARAYLVSKR